MLNKKAIERLVPGKTELETRDGVKALYIGPIAGPIDSCNQVVNVLGVGVKLYLKDFDYCLNGSESHLDIISIYRTKEMREFEAWAKGKKMGMNGERIPLVFNYWIRKSQFIDKDDNIWGITENWRNEWEEYKEELEYVEYTLETIEVPLGVIHKLTGSKGTVTQANNDGVYLDRQFMKYGELFECFTHTDNTPAGVKK